MTNSILTTAKAGFVILTILYWLLLLRQLWQGIGNSNWDDTRKRRVKTLIAGALIFWLIFVSAWSASGMMSDFTKFPFNFLPVIMIPLVTVLIATFSNTFKVILSNIPGEKIIVLQNFRFFVEILLWMLFIISALPVQMTFEGRNFDILAGLTAPLIAYFVMRKKLSRTGVIVWNVFGLLLLTNIVTVAVLSTPSPVRVFMNDPANTIVAVFPISFLPGFLVPLAYTLHFFSLRQATLRRS
jgi:hypothetical protein